MITGATIFILGMVLGYSLPHWRKPEKQVYKTYIRSSKKTSASVIDLEEPLEKIKL